MRSSPRFTRSIFVRGALSSLAGVFLGCWVATPAVAAPSREFTTFVYPQSPNNTYRLPQYAVKDKRVKGLSRCGEKQGEGIRFESDGQTFQLDPVPSSFDNPFRTRVRVRRGKGACFNAELRVVVPLLPDPEPGSWTIQWSPSRPDAIDIIVPSAQLANDAEMRDQHRLVFPWSTRPLSGSWVDCATGCRWRVVADGAVRREFLTRAELPVRVEARPVAGLGNRSAVFNPPDGTIRPRPKLVSLSKWKIEPDIFRSVKVRADQTEVTLDFPGAWAIKPMPEAVDGNQIVHTPAGPVLKFSDKSNEARTFELTPGVGQLKANVRLDFVDQSRMFLNYVGQFRSGRIRMPPEIEACDRRRQSTTVDTGATGGAAAGMRIQFVKVGGSCRNPTGQLFISVFEAVLRATDIESIALDWSEQNPDRLDLYVRSDAIVASAAIREDTELVVGDHPPGKWVACFSEYCHYQIDSFAGASQVFTPSVSIRSKRLQAETTELLDGATGQPFQPQQVEVRNWRTPDPEITVGVPFRDGDRSAVGTISSPLARFFQPGSVGCGGGYQCTIDPNEGAMAVRVQSGSPIQIATIRVPNVPLNDVSLVQVRGEVWREKVRAELVLKLSTCRYSIRQLTRSVAGLNEASILFAAKLRPGSSASCPGDDWRVELKTGERGHARLQSGLLEVYLEAIPIPGEGGSGDVDISFAYPSGQPIKVDGARLAVEPAQTIGPPRVSVRLPGGDLRPLPTTLAVNRPNILYFDSIAEPLDWGVELVRARSLFRSCRGSDDEPDDPKAVQDFSDDESYGSYCIIPNERTNETLSLRFVRQGPTHRLLRAGVDPELLPDEERDRFRRAGWLEVETGRAAEAWSIAMNLVPVTEMRCGSRLIGANQGTVPKAVNFDAFEKCEVRVSLGAPVKSGPDRTPLENMIAFYGDQKLEVRGRLVGGEDTSGTKLLKTVRIRAETEDQEVLVIPVSLAEIGAKPPEDYDIVEVEVAHAANFYAPDDKWSTPNAIARLRVRRGPEYLAWWGDSGRGARIFGAFTATPFSLFRYPHSGKGVTRSEELDQLEAANAALGIAGIIEAWNFDHNESVIPVINPQLQIGALVSSNPTAGDLSLPGISLIAGIGLRTGVGTNPGESSVETSLKTVVWYEMLFQEAGRGNNPSHNLLFGFTVDLGSTPN